jgi:hypothetical protein
MCRQVNYYLKFPMSIFYVILPGSLLLTCTYQGYVRTSLLLVLPRISGVWNFIWDSHFGQYRITHITSPPECTSTKNILLRKGGSIFAFFEQSTFEYTRPAWLQRAPSPLFKSLLFFSNGPNLAEISCIQDSHKFCIRRYPNTCTQNSSLL